ncbi:MAG TPA: radical SAM protein [Bacteroidota bacterium]|nr:radical SAM protein [Bacteroidota bacterium]
MTDSNLGEKNRGPKLKPDGSHILVINEIFHSIQGESSFSGLSCVFVRLTFCNIRCSYCDTEYAFYEGIEMSVDEIVQKVHSYDCKLVEITGGEPLFQPNVHELMKRLCDEEYEVLIETGGSLDVSTVDRRVKKIVDFKCPSSAMMKKNLWKNVEYLQKGDEVKFVIGTREDYEWSKKMMHDFAIEQKCSVLMSVVFGDLEPVQLVEWILSDKLPVRFQLQAHKYIWHPAMKGV